jgi:hypothetical protein
MACAPHRQTLRRCLGGKYECLRARHCSSSQAHNTCVQRKQRNRISTLPFAEAETGLDRPALTQAIAPLALRPLLPNSGGTALTRLPLAQLPPFPAQHPLPAGRISLDRTNPNPANLSVPLSSPQIAHRYRCQPPGIGYRYRFQPPGIPQRYRCQVSQNPETYNSSRSPIPRLYRITIHRRCRATIGSVEPLRTSRLG